MIGMNYAHSNSNRMMMEQISGESASGDDPFASGGNKTERSSSGDTKKPSLLRSQLLRRNTTRTKKRSPGEAVSGPSNGIDITAPEARTKDLPAGSAAWPFDEINKINSGKDAIILEEPITSVEITLVDSDESNPEGLEMVYSGDGNDNIQDDTSNDDSDSFQLHQVPHNEDFEINNGNRRGHGQRIGAKNDESGLDISVIESDEEESKTEAVASPLQREKSSDRTNSTATVTTKNLSIVVTGNDIVVEYHADNGDERKEESTPPPSLHESSESDTTEETSTAAANSMIETLFSPLGLASTAINDKTATTKAPSSSQKQKSTRRRPKGIMKRPRLGSITYHHPRRPLPPPIPPPGYKDISSPRSWTTATTADSSESSIDRLRGPLTAPPRTITTTKKKRVTFDEAMLREQMKSARNRREERERYRRSLLGILSMTMPIIMPYFIAVLILIASSMVPLPTAQRQNPSLLSPLSHLDLVNVEAKGSSRIPSSPPILFDVASRMWDERAKSKDTTESMVVAYDSHVDRVAGRESNAASGNISRRKRSSSTIQSEFAVGSDGDTRTKGSNEKSNASKGLEVVVRTEALKNNNADFERSESKKNPFIKTVASVSKILRPRK